MGNFLMRFADVFVKSIKTMFAQWIDLSAHSMDINSIISLTFIYKYFDLYRGYVKAFFKFRFRRKRRKFKWAHKYYNNKLRSRKFTPALFMFYLNTKQLLLYKKEKGVKPWKMRRRYIVKSICKNIKTKKLRKYILCRMLS
jgi:hypothetical protein